MADKGKNGYIGNVELLKSSSHGTVVTKERSDGSTHTTVYNSEMNRRVSYDRDRDGNVSNIHSTNQNNGKHQNYGSGPNR